MTEREALIAKYAETVVGSEEYIEHLADAVIEMRAA